MPSGSARLVTKCIRKCYGNGIDQPQEKKDSNENQGSKELFAVPIRRNETEDRINHGRDVEKCEGGPEFPGWRCVCHFKFSKF